MHIIYGMNYFESYIHKQHLFWVPILFSNSQNLTVPGSNNVQKFVSVSTSVCFELSIAKNILVLFF